MKFYNQQHKYYCGVDLHARKMYVCILNAKGKVVVHQNIKTDPELQGIFTHKLARAIYFMLKNKEAFDMKRFFARCVWRAGRCQLVA